MRQPNPINLSLRFCCRDRPKTTPQFKFSGFVSSALLSQDSNFPHQEFQAKKFEFQGGKYEFAHLLQSCILMKSHVDGKKVHAQIIVSGIEPNIFIDNNLLNVYSKLGCFEDARQLFDKMPQRNLISWSSIISGFVQNGRGEESLMLFSRFHRSNVTPNEFILASVLRACAELRASDLASQVHDYVIKAGFDSDVFVGTALINFYCKIGDMEEARSVFDKLQVKNSVTWTAIIAGYSQIGKSEISLQLFQRMRKTNVRPDRYVISSVISACSMLQFLDGGKQLHAYILKNEAEIDVSVNNVLLDLYLKCQRVGIACRLFDQMLIKNVVSWTTMIAGHMQNSCDPEALQLFLQLTRQGWRPDGFACTSALSSCGALMALEQGKQVHSYTIKTNLESDEFVKNGLIDMYAKCNSLLDARKSFDIMIEHNVISYNALIEGYAQHGELQESVTIFNKMQFSLVRPSLLTFVSLLRVSASLSIVNLSKQIHTHIVKMGILLHIFVGSSLVDVYSKCSSTDDARQVFEEMNERDIVVWNAMISGYTQNGQGEQTIRLFMEMKLSRMKPNEFTFVAVITAASNLATLLHGSQFHNQIIKTGLEFDHFVANALLDMYAKCGSIDEARKLFDSVPSRDVVCWNSMISRYAQHGHAEESLRLFEQMQTLEIEPNYVTFVGVLSACSHVGLVSKGLYYFDSMKYDFGIEPGTEHYACVVSLLGRARKLREAKEFIERMPIEPAAIVWRSLLGGCRMVGDVDLGKYAAELAISADPKESGPYVLLSNIFASRGMWGSVEKVRKEMNCSGVVKEPGHSWIEVNGEVHVFVVRDKAHREADSIYLALDGLMQQIKGVGYVPDTTFLLQD